MRASRSERGLHNVPAGITSFVGRRQELAEIKHLFSGSRLLTLTGMGGVGKTRLALRVAIDIQRAFPDGVWLAELASLEDPALVTHAMFDALDLRDQSARWLVATLAEYLATKHALIVLDNVEHLLDACAVLADTLLRSCPQLRILVTSRRPLGISGEVSFTVPPLPSPEAVRLFAERAVSVVPGFAVTAENEATVGQLCKQLEGIPLAIELAAARLNVLSVEQLLVRLQDRFALLTTGSRTALPRQQTLWRTIEWSYGLLSLDDQMLWQRLTVFSGSFDLEAIEHVCAGELLAPEAVLDQVGRLVDQSILVRDATRNPVRYAMLESIRQFGREKLHESGGADFRRRHRDYYRQLVTAMQPFGASQVQWFDRLSLEHSNLRTALDYCLTEPGQADAGMELASALWLYWETRGRLSEGRRWIDQFLSSGSGPSAVRARALWTAGYLAVVQGDVPAAQALLQESRDLSAALGDGRSAAFSIHFLGRALLFVDNLGGAAALTEQAIVLHRQAGDETGLGFALVQLAIIRCFQRRAADAIRLLEESADISNRHGERWNLSYVLWALGFATWLAGRADDAAELELRALRLKRDIDDRVGIPLCIEAMAWIAGSAGKQDRAAALLGCARSALQAIPSPLPNPFRTYHDACEAQARARLGDTAFSAASGKGELMSLQEAVSFALEEKVIRPARETQPRGSSPLSRREAETASLVAQGLSNKAVAAKLMISERTVDSHVLNILNKLGIQSRTEIASWVIRHQDSVPASALSRIR